MRHPTEDDRHWTESDFTEWLYGLKTDVTHLDECTPCRGTASATAARKAQAVQCPDIPTEFLTAQRRSIYRRMAEPRHPYRASSIASLAVLILAVAASFGVLRESASNAPLASPADAKLYSELVSIEQSNEPRAIEPIQNLFQE